MMKSILIALTLISMPAFADMLPDGAPAGADARLCIGGGGPGGAFGFCVNDGRGYGWRPAPRPYHCVAENYYGYHFTGYGRWMDEARQNAMGECYRYGSRWCEVRWCD